MALTRLCPICVAAKSECPCPDDAPPAYRGVVIIEWPAAHGASPYSSMTGWKVSVADAVTGKPITTCTRITVHVDPGALVTADLVMLAGADGEPLLDGVPDGDGCQARAFPFLVTEMRVRNRVIQGMRQIPDAQAEMERLAAARKPAVSDPAVRERLAREYKLTGQQIDSLTAESAALLLAAGDDDSKENE